MARPIKKGLDYFSHDTDASTSREIEYLEATHGLTGYAIYLKILEKVYGHEGYYLPWTEIDRAIFAKRCNVDMATVDAIIETCLDVDLFSRWIYDANKVLTSAGIQKRFMQATEKRSRGEIKPEYDAKEGVSASESTPETEIAGVSASETTQEEEISDVSASESTQRKGKERKGKERKQEQLEVISSQTQNTNINALFFSLANRQPNGFEAKTLVEIKNTYQQDKIEYAFKEAGNAGANLKYVLAVLEGRGKKNNQEGGIYRTPKGPLDGWKPPHVIELERLAREQAANAGQ